MPADGHFNPLTGLAKYLQAAGYDVRWYAASAYEMKLASLNIPFYRFRQAMDITADRLGEVFPEREAIKSVTGKLNFDMEHFFIRRAPEYYHDIRSIYQEFPFELLICDVAFTGAVFVKELLKVPVYAIGVLPVTESSRDLGPAGLGLLPPVSWMQKLKYRIMNYVVKNIVFRKPNRLMHSILDEYRITHHRVFIFDLLSRKADLILQSGTPGFEYKRSDLSANIRFIGALLPYRKESSDEQWFDARLNRYKQVLLVTQGTVEKNPEKLLVPVLEAYKNTDTLVVCTTGGSDTAALRKKYPYDNIIIEDFIPFGEIMPYSDVYITNGGYGGVMLGIEHRLPMVVAGVHEGKNEIAARVGYFKCGINLKTETPAPGQVKAAVDLLLHDPAYRKQINRMAAEFSQYDPYHLSGKYVAELLGPESTPAGQVSSPAGAFV